MTKPNISKKYTNHIFLEDIAFILQIHLPTESKAFSLAFLNLSFFWSHCQIDELCIWTLKQYHLHCVLFSLIIRVLGSLILVIIDKQYRRQLDLKRLPIIFYLWTKLLQNIFNNDGLAVQKLWKYLYRYMPRSFLL